MCARVSAAVVLLSALTLLGTAPANGDPPIDDHPLMKYEVDATAWLGGYWPDEDLSYGDLQFSNEPPDAAQLSEVEQRLLFPLVDPPFYTAGFTWIRNHLNRVMAFFKSHGYVPEMLGKDGLRHGRESSMPFPAEYFEYMKNPYTGDWPRYKAGGGSRYTGTPFPEPGDFYIRVLTEGEKVRFAQQDPWLFYLWYLGEEWFRGTDPPTYRPACACPVLYVRLRGEHETIYTALYFHIVRVDPNEPAREGSWLMSPWGEPEE